MQYSIRCGLLLLMFWGVCVCLLQLWALQRMAEPVTVPFGVWTKVGPKKTIVLGECLNPQRKNKFCGDISRHTVKYKEHLVCGQYSQSHSVGGISNVDFCCQSCSNVLLIIITTMQFSYTTTPQDFCLLNCLRCLCINISWILINVTMHSHTNNVNSRKSFQMVQDLKFQHAAMTRKYINVSV